MESNIKHLLEDKDISWIFVSGKGGVGKTTTSMAVLFSAVRESVLVVSTDPAHNISDSFDQKFTSTPTLVDGFTNLYAMEIDPNMGYTELPEELLIKSSEASDLGFMNFSKNGVKQLLNTLPGIDEAMSFGEVMRLVESYNFSLVIFDTAPTGHTLRLMAFPFMIQDTLRNLLKMKSQVSGMFNQFASLLGISNFNLDELTNKLDQLLPIVEKVSKKLKNPKETTFACVCIAEFLSLYETERLIQQLFQLEIDVNTIFVNQLIEDRPCDFCQSRRKTQQNYLNQMETLYEDFHLVKTPMLPYEVRGVDKLKEFSKYLIKK